MREIEREECSAMSYLLGLMVSRLPREREKRKQLTAKQNLCIAFLFDLFCSFAILCSMAISFLIKEKMR
jgi:hypothetical protein